MNIAIYCSANADIHPDFFVLTEQLGRWAGENRHTIVFGGCRLGLMECVAQAARSAGGATIGVVPRIVERGGKTSDNIDVLIPCDNLSDRKELLMSHCDVAIALPGGIGTLDEVFTMAASATIGYHHKPIILYNIHGFWNPLIAVLNHLQQQGMVRGSWQQVMQVAESHEQLIVLLEGMVNGVPPSNLT